MKKLLVVLLALASIAFQSSVNAEPVCELSIDRFDCVLEPNQSATVDFTMKNSGDEPLEWTFKRFPSGQPEFEPWFRRESFMISEALQATRVQGVVYVDGKYIVSAGAIVAGNPNMIWVLDKDMLIIDSYPQFGASRLGFYDLDWDGELIWAMDNSTVYGFTIEGQLVKQFQVAIDYIRGVTWDSRNKQLILCGRTPDTPLIGVSRNGELLNNYGTVNFNKTALGYLPDDPDDHNLYLFSERDDAMVVHKMNLTNMDTILVATLDPVDGGLPEGLFITNQFDLNSWVMLCLVNGTDIEQRYNDRIDVWQLDHLPSWFDLYTPDDMENPVKEGVVAADELLNLRLKVTSGNLAGVIYQGKAQFNHNGVGAEDSIWCSLTVTIPILPAPFDLINPEDEAIIDGTDDSSIRFWWENSFDPDEDNILSYHLFLQTGDDVALITKQDSTNYTIDFSLFDWEGVNLPPPSDSITEYKWWVMVVSGEDTIFSDSERVFTYSLVGEGVRVDPNPVTFGLNSVYPSPFNGMTTIRYGADRIEPMTLRVYDLTGRLMATLADEPARIGTHSVVWNASGFSSGVYLIRLEAGGRVRTVKTAMVK